MLLLPFVMLTNNPFIGRRDGMDAKKGRQANRVNRVEDYKQAQAFLFRHIGNIASQNKNCYESSCLEDA